MKCIYWNIHSIEDIKLIINILEQEKPDVFFISEINDDFINNNLHKLQEIKYEILDNPGCERVKIIKNISLQVRIDLQNKYYTTIFIEDINTYVVSIHLPSQMFQHMKALKEFIRDFRLDIDKEIGCSMEKRILVIGDFNVSSYEAPMIDFDGFITTNSIKSRPTITNLGKKRISYYNPTWQLYSRKHFPWHKIF